MLFIALLLVLVMAGSPVGSLACELWCNTPAGEAHHRTVGCHEASQSGPQGQQIVPNVAGCPDAAVITPFVTEALHRESRPMAAAPMAFFDASSISPDRHKPTTGWWVFNAQPPRPPSPRFVLRI